MREEWSPSKGAAPRRWGFWHRSAEPGPSDAIVPREGFPMQAATFWRTVTRDHADLLDRALQVLEEAGARYCVIDGQAVNAYAEPVVSLDLDLALAPGEVERLGALLAPPIRIERFEHSANLPAP